MTCDAVQVVNAQEVELLARTGVAFYGINLNVGGSLVVATLFVLCNRLSSAS